MYSGSTSQREKEINVYPRITLITNFFYQRIIICVISGQKQSQIAYEQKHLLSKLLVRDLKCYEKLKQETEITPHPIFKIVDGDIADWEIINTKK